MTSRGSRPIALTALIIGCAAHRAPPAPPLAAPTPVRAAEPCLREAPELVATPSDARCIVRGDVTYGDVRWLLRTRLDAVPTLRVEQGTVTGWLLPGERGQLPNAIARVENRAMLLRARVAPEDLFVVATRALTPLPGVVTDGVTERPVLQVEADSASIEIDVDGAPSTAAEVPCGTLGLSKVDVDLSAAMPQAVGELVVKKTASLWTGSGPWSLANQRYPSGAGVPDGLLAEARGNDAKPEDRLVSFRTCGGWLLGTVPKADLLGPPKLLHGSNASCPHTANASVFAPQPSGKLVICERDLSAFMRSITLEDPVGVLKAGAPFRIDWRDRARSTPTTRIVVDAPPALPIAPAEFSIRTQDLAACHESEYQEESAPRAAHSEE